MSGQDARDPYLGLNDHIKSLARRQMAPHYTIGKVLSVRPMLIRAAGMNLDREDLRIAQHLKPGWVEKLSGLAWPLTAELPGTVLQGVCACSAGSGTCQVNRPRETISGKTASEASVAHPQALAVGDEVLLVPSTDGQMYYVVDKLVEVDA